jgi:hypothetical protein
MSTCFEVGESFTFWKMPSSVKMANHTYLMNNTICVKCRSVLHIVSLWKLSFLLKGIVSASLSRFSFVSDARKICTGILAAQGFWTCSENESRDSLTEDVRKMLFAKNLIVYRRRESLHIREWMGMGKPVILWVRLWSDFKNLFWKLDSICFPHHRETKADSLKQLRPIGKGDQEIEKRLAQEELT